MLIRRKKAYLRAVSESTLCHMDGKRGLHLDAEIEVNEIHTAVSRSFVRPKAAPSLPAFPCVAGV